MWKLTKLTSVKLDQFVKTTYTGKRGGGGGAIVVDTEKDQKFSIIYSKPEIR